MENLKKPQARILAYFIRGGTLTVWKAMSKIWHDGAAEDCHEAPAQRLHHRWRLVLQPRRRQRAGCPLQRVSYGR